MAGTQGKWTRAMSARAKTATEAREEFLANARWLASYWAAQPNMNPSERCNGAIFSLLTYIDGNSSGPSFDLVARPSPDDEAFHCSEGDNWMPDGLVINADCLLHDLYYEETGRG